MGESRIERPRRAVVWREHGRRGRVILDRLLRGIPSNFAAGVNRGVAQVLQDEGYIRGFEVVDDNPQGTLRIDLKYGTKGEQIINTISRFSKPGRRVYMGVDELPRPLQGLGVVIVSTSSGVLSDRRCRDQKVGGEVVAIVT